jgi:hypothetical protein
MLPLIALRDEVRYVREFAPLFVGRPRSIAAARRAATSRTEIVLAAQRNAAVDPSADDLYQTGVACTLVHLQEGDDGVLRLMPEGKRRVQISRIIREDSLLAEVTDWPDQTSDLPEVLRLGLAVLRAFDAALEARGKQLETVDLPGLGGPVNASQLLRLGWRPEFPHADASDLVFLAQRYLDYEKPVLPIDVRQQLLEAPSLEKRLAMLEQQLRALATPYQSEDPP